jgi:hypothetical protein
MQKEAILRIFLLACIAGWILACAASHQRWSPPLVHPDEESENLKYCLDCHDNSDENIAYRRYVHTPLFMENHRPVAIQNVDVCNMCHQSRFCNDCHGTWNELKPSIKNQTETDRRMPHRGDYLSRHRIDGRIDPISCRKCHGNPKTASKCRRCHG